MSERKEGRGKGKEKGEYQERKGEEEGGVISA